MSREQLPTVAGSHMSGSDLGDVDREDGRYVDNVARRHRTGKLWFMLLVFSTLVGIVALAALLVNIVDSSVGYVALEDKVDPATLAVGGVPIEDLPPAVLLGILEANVAKGALTRLDGEDPLAERSQAALYALVVERVVQPEVVGSWTLIDSLFRRAAIRAEVDAKHPGARLQLRSWLTPQFIVAAQAPKPEQAGVRTAILGSLWTIAITILVAFPVGVGAAVYLEEYASQTSRANRFIQTNINNLAGVPSIIYGLLGLAIFVRVLEPLTSGALFGQVDSAASANGRTILAAGLTLALLVLPLVIINAQEAIRAVPGSVRQASYGLGASKWQTTWHHVLPGALPGILTGTILSISRAIGETAPLVVIGASTFIVTDPTGPFSKFTTLPIQIYQWTSRPQAEFHNIAAAAIVVLMLLLLSLNITAVLLRNRYSVRY
jgi:phosphate transport system permease protein